MLAQAIFTADICASRQRLQETIFCSDMDASLFLAIMDRPKCDTNVDYVRSIMLNMPKELNLENLKRMITDKSSISLANFLTKTDVELKRDRILGADTAQSYRLLTDEERELQLLEMGQRIMQESSILPAHLTDLVKEEDGDGDGDAMDISDHEEEEGGEEAAEEKEEVQEVLWVPAVGIDRIPNTPQYSWFNTIFYRVNGAHKLLQSTSRVTHQSQRDKFFEHKIKRFYNAHLGIVQYLDSLGEKVDDASLDIPRLLSLYSPLGESHYDCDASLVKVTRTEHQLKRTPLEILTTTYPDLYWRPEEVAVLIRSKREGDPELNDFNHLLDGDEWCPLKGVGRPDPRTHSLYYGVVYVLNQCRSLMKDGEESVDGPEWDALWAYHVSFMELFHFCIPHQRMDDRFLMSPIGTYKGRDGKLVQSDKATPWQLYGTLDTRAFVAGDLPDLYHVLVTIPLWGEQQTPSYFIGKIYQKSLPFACQRRHLIKLVVKSIQDDPTFWSVFSRLVWVMLSNTYPGDLACRQSNMGMRELLRAKELCESKELLIAALTAKQPGFDKMKEDDGSGEDEDDNATQSASASGSNGGPLVVFTIFRLHILFMASFNDQYVSHARQCIDWDYFKKDVIKLANIVREQSLFPADPFAQARKQLSKTVKSPHARVHRLRRRSMAISLMDQFNETLEKSILKDRQNHTNDYSKLCELRTTLEAASVLSQDHVDKFCATFLGADIFLHKRDFVMSSMSAFSSSVAAAIETATNAKEYYSRLVNISCKSAILNILIRIPPQERLTRNAFSVLMEPAYGGVSQACVELLCQLVNIYHTKAAPKEFRQRIVRLNMRHFMVACFYFNMVALLDKISFVPLDAETVQRTDLAMTTRRHRLYPGQEVPENIFNVSVALCCEKVCTLMGQGKHGDKKVAYDIEKQSFVCAHGRNMKKDDDVTGGGEEGPAGVSAVLGAQNDDNDLNDIVSTSAFLLPTPSSTGEGDLTSDASSMKGRGAKRAITMQERKAVRNERKAFSKIPCGQPVLTFSLRGRALIWGNTLENKTQIMFCPECGALHMYTILNFSGSETGRYRCNECARKELMHVPHYECAYCGRSPPGQITDKTRLEILCPMTDPSDPTFDPLEQPENVWQWLYFCKSHYRIACRYNYARGGVPKKELWTIIKHVQDMRILQQAKGLFHRK